MGRIEGRTIADYGLPWRRMFRIQFWQGVLLGFASLTGLLVAMRARWGLLFRRHRAARLRHLPVGRRLRACFHPCRSARRVSRPRIRAVHALGRHRLLARRNLSAAFFGYSHHGNSGEDWVGLVNAGAFGLLLCFLLHRTGNLWLPIGLHLAFDWGETYFYGVADSGQMLPGHLLNSTGSGPPCYLAEPSDRRAACSVLC